MPSHPCSSPFLCRSFHRISSHFLRGSRPRLFPFQSFLCSAIPICSAALHVMAYATPCTSVAELYRSGLWLRYALPQLFNSSPFCGPSTPCTSSAIPLHALLILCNSARLNAVALLSGADAVSFPRDRLLAIPSPCVATLFLCLSMRSLLSRSAPLRCLSIQCRGWSEHLNAIASLGLCQS